MNSRSDRMLFAGVEPRRAHDTDAGYDLFAVTHHRIWPGDVVMIDTGTHVAIPEGHVGLVKDRSSLGVKGIHVTAGVIDPGFTGPVKVVLANVNRDDGLPFDVAAGDRIAQLLVIPVAHPELVRVPVLPSAQRGWDGFGSTGR